MTHEECQDRLLELSYGELDRRSTREVRAHLARCPVCAGVYRRIAGVREVMGRLEPEPPPGGERVVLAAAREAADRQREERPSLGLPLWAWKASVATVLVAAVAGVSVKVISMRQRSTVEEIAAAPAAPGPSARSLEDAPPAAPRAEAPPAAARPAEAPPAEAQPAEVPGRRAAPERPALASRAPSKPAPAPSAAAPAPARVGFAERRAAGPASSQAPVEPEERGPARLFAEAPPDEPARRERAAAEAAPARAKALADAESKSAAAARAAAAPPRPAPAKAAPSRWAVAPPQAAPEDPAVAGAAAQPQAAPEEPAPPEAAPAPPQAEPEGRAPSEFAAPPAQAPAAPPPAPAPAAASRKDPRVKAAQAVVQDVDSRQRRGQLSESARAFQACGTSEDAERRLYADASGRAVKYVRQVGSAEAALTYEQYYDAQGRLRHVYVHGGAVNGAVLEHRIWLDGAGTRLREERRFRRGRFPFPEVWPEAELRLRAPDASALRCGAP